MLKRILSGGAAQFFNISVVFFERFIITAILLHYWGVELYEEWSLLLAAVAFFGVFSLGFHNYFGNIYLFEYEQGKYRELENSIRLSIFFNLLALSLGVCALLTLSLFTDLMEVIGVSEVDEESVSYIYILLGLMVLAEAASASITELYRAHRKYARGIIINSLLILTRSVSIGIIAALGAGPLIGAFVFLILTILFLFVFVPIDQNRSLHYSRYGIKIPLCSETIETWHGSKWYFAQNIPSLLQLNLPVLLLGNSNMAPGILAAFIMSRTITNFVRQVMQSFIFILGQEMSRAYARGEKELLRKTYIATNRLACTFTGALLGCLLALADPFFSIWSGGTVDYNYMLMTLLVLSVGLSIPAMVSLTFLFYIQQARSVTLARSAQAAISLSLSILLVSSYGAVGIAVALLVGEVAGMSFVVLPEGAKRIDITLTNLTRQSIFYLIAGFLPCIIAGAIIRIVNIHDTLIDFGLAVIFLIPILSLTTWFIGIIRFQRRKILAEASLLTLHIRKGDG